MKRKYQFVLRVLLYSLPLYLIGQKLLRTYTSALTASLVQSGTPGPLPNNLGEFLYAPSMAVIAFCALILATPKLPILKKGGMVGIGILAFVLTDVVFIQCLKWVAPLSDDSVIFELYLCVKSLLAWVLWLAMGYPYVGGLLRSG